jgi:hypothetical protein
MNYLTFINDHDVADPNAESIFSYVKVYEDPLAGKQVLYSAGTPSGSLSDQFNLYAIDTKTGKTSLMSSTVVGTNINGVEWDPIKQQLYYASWDGNAFDLYTWDPKTDTHTRIKNNLISNSSGTRALTAGTLDYINDHFYFIGNRSNRLYRYDLSTDSLSSVQLSQTTKYGDLAFTRDSQTGDPIIYGSATDYWWRVNWNDASTYDDFIPRNLRPDRNNKIGLGLDGILYGWANQVDGFGKLDPATGLFNEIIGSNATIRMTDISNADFIQSIDGSIENDTLTGDYRPNILNGKEGDDVLTGGASADTFILSPGHGTDTILDFLVGTDLLGLTDSLSFDLLTIAQGTGSNANDTLINYNGEDLAVLTGIQANTITQSSFIIV